MNNKTVYASYIGNEPFVFLLYERADRTIASRIINDLIDRQFRVCYEEYGARTSADNDWIAQRMLASSLAVFLISAASLTNPKFRNCINYTLGTDKKSFFVYLDDRKLEYGFDMQLAKAPGVKLCDYKATEELYDDIVKTGLFTQDMRGEDAKIALKNNRWKKVTFVAIASVLVVLMATAAWMVTDRINYNNSYEGWIARTAQFDSLDISGRDVSTLDLLKGKTIKTLIVRNMGLDEIDPLEWVQCEEIDLSGNPGIDTLEPLLGINGLETVWVTQDMADAMKKLRGRNRFRIFITG